YPEGIPLRRGDKNTVCANANVNAYEMRLQRGYAELSKEEMEYDGGWKWNSFFSAVVVGAALTAFVVLAAPIAIPAIAITTVTASSVGSAMVMGGITGGIGYIISDAAGY
ncbi:MAG: hypothetical protein LBU30_04930, partial [Candidatus Methanoplasma sp.]|nr:hypothetical protein [Candidatus Methanoplasma sp.]